MLDLIVLPTKMSLNFVVANTFILQLWTSTIHILIHVTQWMHIMLIAQLLVSNTSSSSFQSTVVIPMSLVMAPLNHIKTQLRELKYSSDVTQCLFQLRGWELFVELMGCGPLTRIILIAHVSVYCTHKWDDKISHQNFLFFWTGKQKWMYIFHSGLWFTCSSTEWICDKQHWHNRRFSDIFQL